MDQRILWMCLVVGSTVGGYVPTFFGYGSFSLASLLGGAVGAVAGVWAAARLSELV
jgi:uncharacterized membrane protein YeaQ/YmgE (transglycosylase-associated protein family)